MGLRIATRPVLGIFFLLFLAGCAPAGGQELAVESASVAKMVEQNVAATVAALPTLTPTNPPVIIQSTPDSFSSFSLPSEVELTAQAPTQTPPPPPTATATAVPDATLTPQPTFTPPSLPFTSADEHFWFRRPVPEGTAVWTDKAYPYGSNKGGTLRTHRGVEFNVDYNTEILAAASGTVVFAGQDNTELLGENLNFYGNVIVIEHDSRWQNQPVYTLYGHLGDIYVSVGQFVDMQQVIGLSGASGIADGPHLHFEVRIAANSYDTTRNPLLWLYPFPQKAAVAGVIRWPDGRSVANAPVRLVRVDAPNRYQATTTYADNDVNPDAGLGENFVLDDVDPGYYEIIVDTGAEKFTTEFWVFPYQTSFVEIVLE